MVLRHFDVAEKKKMLQTDNAAMDDGEQVGSAGDPYMKYVSDVLALTSDVGTAVRAMKLAEVQLGSCTVKIGKFCSFFLQMLQEIGVSILTFKVTRQTQLSSAS